MNSLVEFKKLLSEKKTKSYIAVVESILGNKARVQLGNSSTVVWGIASVGDTVMISNAQIIAIVDKETIETVHIP